MKLILASNNDGKIAELTAILNPLGFDVVSMAQVGFNSDIEENGITLHENAYIKAKTIHDQYNCPVLSDDSGLFIPALDGAPGVHSARYAGEHKSNQDNIQKVLNTMEGIEARKAYFACVLCLIIEGEVQYFEGRIYGKIDHNCTGKGGFGYDPIFIPNGYEMSFGDLDSELKNTISHRANALKKLTESLSWR